jgi:RNA polymerase sigma factor (sigma-70 family)
MNKYAESADAQLVQSCLRGEADAWEALIDRYKRLIYSIPRKYHLGEEEAADVFQAVCLIMLKRLGTLKDQSKLSSWLIKTTMRECWKLKRRAKAGAGEPLHQSDWQGRDEEGADPMLEIPDQEKLPDEVLETLEQQHVIRQGVSQLPDRCRRLLTMLFYEQGDWTYEQISQELGIPVSSIGPIRGRCLGKLKKALESLGFG